MPKVHREKRLAISQMSSNRTLFNILWLALFIKRSFSRYVFKQDTFYFCLCFFSPNILQLTLFVRRSGHFAIKLFKPFCSHFVFKQDTFYLRLFPISAKHYTVGLVHKKIGHFAGMSSNRTHFSFVFFFFAKYSTVSLVHKIEFIVVLSV